MNREFFGLELGDYNTEVGISSSLYGMICKVIGVLCDEVGAGDTVAKLSIVVVSFCTLRSDLSILSCTLGDDSS